MQARGGTFSRALSIWSWSRRYAAWLPANSCSIHKFSSAEFEGERSAGLTLANSRSPLDCRGKIEQRNRHSTRLQCEHHRSTPGQYYGCAGHPQDRGIGCVCDSQRFGECTVNRRSFMLGMAGLASISVCHGNYWQRRFQRPPASAFGWSMLLNRPVFNSSTIAERMEANCFRRHLAPDALS